MPASVSSSSPQLQLRQQEAERVVQTQPAVEEPLLQTLAADRVSPSRETSFTLKNTRNVKTRPRSRV